MECPRCFEEFDETEDNRKCPNCGYIADNNESFDKLKGELEDKKEKRKNIIETIRDIPLYLLGLVFYIPSILLVLGVVVLLIGIIGLFLGF